VDSLSIWGGFGVDLGWILCRFGVDLEWVCSCFEPQGDVFWTLKSCLLMTPTNETFLWVGVDLEWAGVDLEWAGVDLEWAGVDLEWAGVDLEWAGVDLEWAGVGRSRRKTDQTRAGCGPVRQFMPVFLGLNP
jgi:hypothetical protein